MSGRSPDISPVEEFSVTPEGKAPDVIEYVIVESESVAVAEIETDICSSNVPRDPEAVCHIGLLFINSASGRMPNKLDGFVTFTSYGSYAGDKFIKFAVS